MAAESGDPSAAQPGVLITVTELTEAMLSSRPPVVLDVRWQLGRTDGHDGYLAGHVPGAVFVDLDRELAAPPSAADGRHPLPPIGELQESARSWGIDDGVPVVVYDDCGGTSAARAWWLLRWGGLREVRILDGGLGAWRAAGLRCSAGNTEPRRGAVTLTPGAMPAVTIDDVAAGGTPLLDARLPERFRGEVEPFDPRPGHIPGAVSVPTAANVGADGRFRPAAELRERFAAAGVTPRDPADGASSQVVVYCGSGVHATHQVAALAIAGIDAALFPGSFSQWSNDPARPVVRGPE